MNYIKLDIARLIGAVDYVNSTSIEGWDPPPPTGVSW